MDDVARDITEKLYDRYRKNFNTLESLFLSKGKELPSVSESLKIKGETFYSQYLTQIQFDFAIHSCGLTSYPSYLLEQNRGLDKENSLQLSQIQKEELSKIFSEFDINLELFEEATKASRGLWIEYLHSRDIQEYLKVIPKREPGAHLNFTGQVGDILGVLIPNYREVITSLVQSPSFKKITDTSSPQNRMGVISNFFLELFINKHYQCNHFELTKCINCQSDFLPQSNLEWVNRVPPVFCNLCLTLGFSASNDFSKRLGFNLDERRENYLRGVQIYSDYFGFIPPVGYQKRKVIQQLFQSGVSTEEISFAIKVSSLLPWTDSVKEIFGTWAHFLEEAGLLSQRQRGRGGHQSIASDGHLCLSMGERAICEFLSRNSISHEREPMYPIDEKLNPNGLLRGDFLIGDLIIEFAGMMSNPDYSARMKIKEKLAKSRNIPWLKLETSKLDGLNEMLVIINSKVSNPNT